MIETGDTLFFPTEAANGARLREHAGLAHRIAVAIVKLAVASGVLVAAFFVGGFLWFTHEINTRQMDIGANADGIVVLTGGRDRVTEGLELLSNGQGGRLLISGVHPETSASAIARENDAPAGWFDCCVDLGYRAENTFGNAAETRNWAREHKARSLIIVTSAYHMPRSMAAMRAAMPDVVLIPHPVRPPELGLGHWWTDPTMAKLLFSEYLKYILARTRLDLGGKVGELPAARQTTARR